MTQKITIDGTGTGTINLKDSGDDIVIQRGADVIRIPQGRRASVTFTPEGFEDVEMNETATPKTTDHEQLLEMRRLLKEAAHIGRQVRAQMLRYDTPRAQRERYSLYETIEYLESATYQLETYAIPNAEAAPIELADLCEMETGETLIHSRLLDASGFPNARRVVPDGFTTDFRIERKTLSEIVRRVSLVVNDGENKVVVFSVDEHSITVMGRGDNTGVAEETVDHLGGTGQMQFCMMVNYIQEMLSALDDEILRVQAVGHLIPIMFTGDNQDYLYLQAPCNIPAWAKVETEALKAA